MSLLKSNTPAPVIPASASPDLLAQQLAAKDVILAREKEIQKFNAQEVALEETKSELMGKSYQLPSAPCSISFPWGAKHCYESVYTTSDSEEIAYLDKMVKCGNVSYAHGNTGRREHTPPPPVAKAVDAGNGTIV